MDNKYDDSQYHDWYEKYLEEFDYEESKVAVERLGVAQQVFCRTFWVVCIFVLLLICFLGAWTWRYFDCNWGDAVSCGYWHDWVCGMFQNACMGLGTGLILMLYTNKRDQSLACSEEMLKMLEFRKEKFQGAFDDLRQIPFSDETEREGVVRNRYILHCFVALGWHIVDFHTQLFSKVNNKKTLLDKDRQEYAKLFELWCSIGNSDNPTPYQRFLRGNMLVHRLLNRTLSCIEEVRMNVYEMRHGTKAVVKSASMRKAIKHQTARRKRLQIWAPVRQ